jgi:hypothetical protein
LVQCAAGVPTNDVLYTKLLALQNEGKSYTAEQTALKATGEFVYKPYLDPARDALTSHAEVLHRTGGALNLGVGTFGTVGGGIITGGGAASCLETFGLGCAVGAFGAYITTASAQQAQQGNQALFGQFQSTEGQRVLNSLNVQTFPGEKDALASAGLDAIKLGAIAVAGKVIPKGLAAAEDFAAGTRGAAVGSAGTKGVGAGSAPITPHPLEGITPNEVIEKVRSLGLQTQRDELILWSGLGPGRIGIERSQAYAVDNGGRTLEMTPGGKWLDEMNLYGKNSPFTQTQADYIWGNVSRSLVEGASGQLRALQGAVRPTSVYRGIELPAAIANPNVTGIEPIPLKPTYNFGK